MSTAPQRTSHVPVIFPARTATRFQATCFAGDRTELPSSLCFVVIRNQPLQQANAKPRTPALIDVGFRRAHRGSRDIEMRPRRVVDEALQELRGGDRAAVAGAGVLHVTELRIDLLTPSRTHPHAPTPL